VGDDNQLNEAIRQNGSRLVTNYEQYMVTNTRVFTSTLVTTGPEVAFSRDVVTELAIPGLAGGLPVQWGIPGVGFTDGYSRFGNDSEGPYENKNTSLQLINNLSWITGDSFADFPLGQPYQAEAAVSIANADFRANTFYLYFDDTWKITQKLTVNYGLRYENTLPWEDQTGTLFNAILPNEVHPTDYRNAAAPRSMWPFFQRQRAARQNCYEGVKVRWPNINVKCDGKFGNRLVSRDNNDFAPRLGITFAPTPNLPRPMGSSYRIDVTKRCRCRTPKARAHTGGSSCSSGTGCRCPGCGWTRRLEEQH